ncbi:MAG TPA: cysteine dioxygenase family protein [Polyangia bacterium]|nr:cysteine dioxygenase family protein [Polyangia bacterium]
MHARAAPLVTPARAPIAQLLHDLRALGDLRRRAAAVDALLEGWHAPLDRLLGYLPLPRHGYARTLLHRCDAFELLLLTWAEGSRSPIHDHAEQDCWLVPLAGAFDLDDYAILDEDDAAARLLPLRRRQLGPGALDHRDEHEAVHAVAPATPHAVSLHLYARPIDRCRIFDRRRGSFSWHRLGYDAVAPQLGE